MKKKMLKVLFIGFVLTSLAACSNDKSASPAKTKDTESSSSVAESTKESTSSSNEVDLLEETLSSEESSEGGNSKLFEFMIEAAQSQLPTMKEQLGGTYSNIEIAAGENHTVIYKYTFTDDPGLVMDSEALKPVMVKAMKPVMDSVKGMVPDAKIQVIYLRPDQSELGNILITQEDTDAVQDESDPV